MTRSWTGLVCRAGSRFMPSAGVRALGWRPFSGSCRCGSFRFQPAPGRPDRPGGRFRSAWVPGGAGPSVERRGGCRRVRTARPQPEARHVLRPAGRRVCSALLMAARGGTARRAARATVRLARRMRRAKTLPGRRHGRGRPGQTARRPLRPGQRLLRHCRFRTVRAGPAPPRPRSCPDVAAGPGPLSHGTPPAVRVAATGRDLAPGSAKTHGGKE